MRIKLGQDHKHRQAGLLPFPSPAPFPHVLAKLNSVMDLVPSEMACLESSPGRTRRTAVWVSLEEMMPEGVRRHHCARTAAGEPMKITKRGWRRRREQGKAR